MFYFGVVALMCNIDARGKAVRLRFGLVAGLAGLVALAFCYVNNAETWAWSLAVASLATGAFAVFEARAGWCALRALGVKTSL